MGTRLVRRPATCANRGQPPRGTAWHASTEAYRQAVEHAERFGSEPLTEAFYVLVTCRDERQQVELLARFQGEGLECKALLT